MLVDQDNNYEEDTGDYDSSLPRKYLSQWFLVKAPAQGEWQSYNSASADNGRQQQQQQHVMNDAYFIHHTERIPLPETGIFAKNVILYGWLLPRNRNEKEGSVVGTASSGRDEDGAVFVRITQLDRWVIDRSKERRGFWVMTRHASYWLQRPCSYHPEVLLAKKLGNDKYAKNSGPFTLGRKRKRSTAESKRAREDHMQDSTNEYNLRNPFDSHNEFNDMEEIQASPDIKEQGRVFLPSQEDIHLTDRLRLGLLSNLLDIFSKLTDDELEEISELTPQSFVAWLESNYSQRDATKDGATSRWKALQSHGKFLGTHLMFSHPCFKLLSPLLRGFLTAGNVFQYLESSVDVSLSGGKAQGEGKKRGRPRKESQSLIFQIRPHQSRSNKSKLNDSNMILQYALDSEHFSQQFAWGEPMKDTSPQQMIPQRLQDTCISRSERVCKIKSICAGSITTSPVALPRCGRLVLQANPEVPSAENSGILDQVSTVVHFHTTEAERLLKLAKSPPKQEDTQNPNPPRESSELKHRHERQSDSPGIAADGELTLQSTKPPHSEKKLSSQTIRTPGTDTTATLEEIMAANSESNDGPWPNENSTHEEFHSGGVRHDQRQLDPPDVATVGGQNIQKKEGSSLTSPIVILDSNSDNENEHDEHPKKHVIVFVIRKGEDVIKVRVQDLSQPMKRVFGRGMGKAGSEKVFGCTKEERKDIQCRKKIVVVTVGSMNWEKGFFDNLTAQDVVEDIAPLPLVVPISTEPALRPRPREVALELSIAKENEITF